MTPERELHRSRSGPDHEAAIAGAPYVRHRRVHRSSGHPRPRILQLLATGGTGGAQESYTGLLLGLDRSRYEVRALSLSAGSAVQRIRRLGLDVDVLEEPDDEAAVRALAGYLRREEIDLVHAHMYRAEVVGTRAALAAGTPVVMATVHSSRVRPPEDVAALAALTPAMDRLIVPSEAIAAKVRAEGRGGARFAVIPNGIDLARFSVPVEGCGLHREFGVPKSDVVVGVVARLEPEKGHRHLIEAWPSVVERAPGTWLVIVGDGSLEGELRARAAALPAPARDRVRFAGRHDDISALTAELDVAVLPSLREAQGISLLEAMARRVPVVASAVGGIPEVVTDGVDGLLVPPSDPAALADAIVRLALSPALRARIGEAGYRTVAERFSIDAQVRRIQELYDEELDRAGVTAALRRARSVPVARSRAGRPSGRAALEVPPV
ncbi:MAG TPA: glycosyltransferase family 4 protein [candidate division Zixibacteria bacterium]|nr:glycosyltransferase family 4 protein [candidate division Zixibacteria bacterium]